MGDTYDFDVRTLIFSAYPALLYNCKTVNSRIALFLFTQLTQAMPIEWNAWVLFRHSVDIILLNDFLSYFFCGISFLTFPDPSDSKAVFMCALRWVSGITLLVFNLWVKTDAHRIITDLAWYWADTFFQSMQDLVFDGVFEMAPHP
jgi:phosphatidylethanolamine N-methyltransferase